MRLADWPRMPYLNDELREWIALQLRTLGMDEIAVYAVEAGGEDEQRRVLIATEMGLLDGWYAPRGTAARYSLQTRLYPWQAVRDVDLRVETYRVWALEHRTRWHLRIKRPSFESATESPDLGAALADFAKVAAVMAEPSGWQPEEESEASAATTPHAAASQPEPAKPRLAEATEVPSRPPAAVSDQKPPVQARSRRQPAAATVDPDPLGLLEEPLGEI